jgi:hypothetical protein
MFHVGDKVKSKYGGKGIFTITALGKYQALLLDETGQFENPCLLQNIIPWFMSFEHRKEVCINEYQHTFNTPLYRGERCVGQVRIWKTRNGQYRIEKSY